MAVGKPKRLYSFVIDNIDDRTTFGKIKNDLLKRLNEEHSKSIIQFAWEPNFKIGALLLIDHLAGKRDKIIEITTIPSIRGAGIGDPWEVKMIDAIRHIGPHIYHMFYIEKTPTAKIETATVHIEKIVEKSEKRGKLPEFKEKGKKLWDKINEMKKLYVKFIGDNYDTPEQVRELHNSFISVLGPKKEDKPFGTGYKNGIGRISVIDKRGIKYPVFIDVLLSKKTKERRLPISLTKDLVGEAKSYYKMISHKRIIGESAETIARMARKETK